MAGKRSAAVFDEDNVNEEENVVEEETFDEQVGFVEDTVVEDEDTFEEETDEDVNADPTDDAEFGQEQITSAGKYFHG